MSTNYFWDGKQVLTHTTSVPFGLEGKKYLADRFHNMPCYTNRSGIFFKFNYLGWKRLPKSRIPAKFKVHLLLLGVS